jgi:hypothetical protein
MVEIMLENRPLCLHLAQEELRKARMILEESGCRPDRDASVLISLRKKLEASFDVYLDQKTASSRQEFVDVVAQVQQLQATPS